MASIPRPGSAPAHVRVARDRAPVRDRYTVDAVASALDVLKIVAEMPDLGLSEIARRAGESKARTFRLLRTLEQQGYVTVHAAARTYRLGFGAVVLGQLAARQVQIVQAAQPILKALGERFEETTQLSVREGDDTVCIASWVPQRALRVQGRVGNRRPMHAGSSKALFAFTPAEFQTRILAGPLERFTSATITDPKALRAILARIRTDGFYVSRGEVSADLVSIAAPVFGADGLVAGQINIAAPQSRMGGRTLKEATREVVASACELTAVLQGQPGPA